MEELSIDKIGQEYPLQFILYCAQSYPTDPTSGEDEIFKFADEVPYYKTHKFECFTAVFSISKIGNKNNLDK
jgi:hypothetical protein